MLFNSLTFVVFFVIVVTLYWSIGSWTLRKNLLVVASYIFYAAWNPPFAALLFGTTAMDFWLGRQMGKVQDRQSRKWWLVGSVYAAIGFSDFWRRWHISLSTFLSDYLYIPLGGNQVRPLRAAANLVIVMFAPLSTCRIQSQRLFSLIRVNSSFGPPGSRNVIRSPEISKT